MKNVPFFNYPHLFKSHEDDFVRIFKDVGYRGAYILQKDLIDFEKNAIKQVINEDKDFEVARFSHSVYQTSNPLTDSFTDFTDINYNFNFVPSGATSATTVWLPSYTVQGFTPDEVFYFRNQSHKQQTQWWQNTSWICLCNST